MRIFIGGTPTGTLRHISVDGTGVVIERKRILEAMPILRNRQSYMWGTV